MPPKLPYEEFYNRTERQENGCLVWTGPKGGGWRDDRRYGTWGRQHYAHHEAYEREYGPIPDGMQVLHSCDNPLCVEPTHLRAGTQTDNQLDAIIRGRRAGLTPIQRREIQVRRWYGERPGVLADEFGVTRWTVNRLAWR